MDRSAERLLDVTMRHLPVNRALIRRGLLRAVTRRAEATGG